MHSRTATKCTHNCQPGSITSIGVRMKWFKPRSSSDEKLAIIRACKSSAVTMSWNRRSSPTGADWVVAIMLLMVVKDVAGTSRVGSCVMTHQHTKRSVHHQWIMSYIYSTPIGQFIITPNKAHRKGGDAKDIVGAWLKSTLLEVAARVLCPQGQRVTGPPPPHWNVYNNSAAMRKIHPDALLAGRRF